MTGHGEPTAGLPGPDLRADIVDDRDIPPSLSADSRLEERPGQAEIETRIIDQADHPGPVGVNPSQRLRKNPLEETVVAQHFGQSDDRRCRQIKQQLSTGILKFHPAQRRDFQVRFPLQCATKHPGRLLIAGMFSGDDEQINRPVDRRQKRCGHGSNGSHVRSETGFGDAIESVFQQTRSSAAYLGDAS